MDSVGSLASDAIISGLTELGNHTEVRGVLVADLYSVAYGTVTKRRPGRVMFGYCLR